MHPCKYVHIYADDYQRKMQRIVARVTDRSGYGVNRSRAVQHSTSESELDYYRAKILCQKFQRLTSPATTPPIADLRRDDKKEIEKPIGDIYDLMEAGSCLFGNSQFPAFKSTDQSNFTATVLNGDRKLLALQAPTSFGKTVTYLLPMMVLAKTRPGKFIHFVSVPYVALKTATMKRVQQAGLVAADSSALGAIDFYTQVVTIDVIVGVFDGFAQDECVSKWDVMYGGCRKLGYFVIDEFHVLEVEKTFQAGSEKIKKPELVLLLESHRLICYDA
ncbi:hypothetical protein SEUBUCD650_0H00110 [Saccharomyces eubayanus]|uniref:DEAD/DEAH-box helicase domain-containing protein n=1 Tax=Saccharomyces eubayanus TaxID=1080349 RepID=A0ABN8VQS9_SACEU|nr:hypothetical protein SEUBUCD650_0H00110 [Saccharomyces eubayanus]